MAADDVPRGGGVALLAVDGGSRRRIGCEEVFGGDRLVSVLRLLPGIGPFNPLRLSVVPGLLFPYLWLAPE